MRKVVLFIASSLDGYIAGEGGSIEWLFTDEDYGYSKFYRSIDTIIMGRRTYDQLLEFDEYPYNGKKAYVFTRNAKRTNDGHADFISSDIASFCKETEELNGKRHLACRRFGHCFTTSKRRPDRPDNFVCASHNSGQGYTVVQ